MLSGAKPLFGHAAEFIRNPIGVSERGYEEKGEIFSVNIPGRPVVMLIGSEHNRFFFSETDRLLSIRTAYPFFARMFDPAFYFFAGMDEYKRQRALVLPRFHGKQLQNYVSTMVEEVEELDEGLGESGEFDLVEVLGPLVMRIAARVPWPRVLDAAGGRVLREVPPLLGRDGPGHARLAAAAPPGAEQVRQARAPPARGELDRRAPADPLEPGDFLQTLVEARYEDGDVVPDEVLINLILLFSWAGHETTTGHISWALIDLLQHPDKLQRVVGEAQGVLGAVDIDELSLKDVGNLKYLDHALHETERLHLVAFTMARTAAETFEYQGCTIPKGSMVMISPAVTHRLPDLYEGPDEYRPERFEENPKETKHLVGFGGGIHRCLGVHFAYLEMTIALACLLREFEFELVDKNPRPVPGSHAKWPEIPCRVRYTRKVRDRAAA